MASIELKSELFRHFDMSEKRNEDFPRDMKHLFQVWSEDAKQKIFREKIPNVLLTDTNLGERDAIDELSVAISELPTLTIDAVNCVSFILNHLTSTKGRSDKPVDLASDMIALRILDESEESKAAGLLKWLKNDLLPSVESELRRRGAATGLFPSLKGISIDAELRAVQIDKYTSMRKVKDYEPNITAIVPIASIQIRTTEKDFVFQGDQDDLNMMIDYLEASVKDLKALENLGKGEGK